MLPNREPRGAGWEPPLPLILAAWWEASHSSKRARLKEHLAVTPYLYQCSYFASRAGY